MATQSFNENRHAYLIICHNNWKILKSLLQLLDDERNDIYLHVDKKTKEFPEKEIRNVISKSNLIILPRQEVNWGGYSMIKVELALLNEATKSYHSYYHLLSGVDMPLKTQDEIHYFFSTHDGNNYIAYDWAAIQNSSYLERIKKYHFFQDKIGRNVGKKATIMWYIEGNLLKLQKCLSINRIRGREANFFKGTNWFSITHSMALYVISKSADIKKLFCFSLSADEIFLQTIAKNSPLQQSIVDDSLRYIDWKRGNPYTFRSNDYYGLLKSQKLFARKFDENVDIEVVHKLVKHLGGSRI